MSLTVLGPPKYGPGRGAALAGFGGGGGFGTPAMNTVRDGGCGGNPTVAATFCGTGAKDGLHLAQA